MATASVPCKIFEKSTKSALQKNNTQPQTTRSVFLCDNSNSLWLQKNLPTLRNSSKLNQCYLKR